MDFNGNPTEGTGGGSVPDDIDINSVCAVSGTFQNLGVGSCGFPAYEFPTTAKGAGQSKGIIVSQGGTVELVDIVSNRFTISYGIGLNAFVRTLILTAQEYELQTLLSELITVINNQIATDTGTNTVSLSLGGDGKINFSINDGNVKDFSISDDSGFGLLGNTDNSSFPTPNLRVFANEPTYSDTTNYTSWSTYRFDDNGNVYSGDMTITGSLSVSTIISDIEVEDAIITLNKNGVADDNTSGFVLNNSTNTKFSGLLKKDNSDDFYLFANSTTLPTESGWEAEQTGNLYLNNLSVNTEENSGLLTIEASGINDTPLYVKGAVGQTADLLRVANNADVSMMSVSSDGRITTTGGLTTTGQLETLTGIRTGLSGVEYILPSARGTLGQVMTSDGAGNVLFQDIPVGTSLISPGGNSSIFVDDFETATQVNGIIRFKSDSGETRINSPTTDTNIILQSSGIDFSVAGSTLPLSITSATTTIRGGPANTTFSTYQDASYQLNQGGQVRILADNSDTYLYSPDGVSSSHRITDDAQVLTVDGDDRLTMDSTLTTLTNASGGTFLELGNSASRLSYNGVNAVECSSVVNYFRGGVGGFSELQLGGLAFGLDYRFNGIQRLKVSGVASQLFSPDAQSEFDVGNSRLNGVVDGIARLEMTALTNNIADSSGVDRFVADATSTRLFAPSGGNKLDVAPSGIISSGAFSVNTSDVNDVGVIVSAPVGQVGNLQKWRVDGSDVATVDNQGNGAFNNVFIASSDVAGSVISNVVAVPLNIGPSTHTDLNIGYAGAPTTINGAVDVPNGLTIGATPNKYAFPLVAGAEGQHLEVNASGDLAYTYGQIFASVQANSTTAMALPLQNTYYPLPNATTNAQVGGFTFGALGLATYNGAYPLFLRVGAHCSIERSSGGGADIFSFSILKNGAVFNSIGECRAKFDDAGTFPLEVSFEGIVAVVNGDTLQLAVANEDAAATTANVYSYSFVISKI